MPVKLVKSAEIILARLIPLSEWHEGLRFFSDDPDYIQVGTWNYPAGKKLAPHTHNEVSRQVCRTCEALFIYHGSVKASIYDSQDCLAEELELHKGDTLILLAGGHGYEIMEDGTRVLEIKNGPYPGAEVDRRIIDQGECGEPQSNENRDI